MVRLISVDGVYCYFEVTVNLSKVNINLVYAPGLCTMYFRYKNKGAGV